MAGSWAWSCGGAQVRRPQEVCRRHRGARHGRLPRRGRRRPDACGAAGAGGGRRGVDGGGGQRQPGAGRAGVDRPPLGNVGRRSELDARVQPRADEGYYVALGDSYMSGEGAREFISGTNTVEPNESRTNECRRATSAWGYRLAEVNYGLEDVPHRVLFLPCSGAVAGNIDTVEYKPNKHQAILLAEYFRPPSGSRVRGQGPRGNAVRCVGDCRVGQQMLDCLWCRCGGRR